MIEIDLIVDKSCCAWVCNKSSLLKWQMGTNR